MEVGIAYNEVGQDHGKAVTDGEHSGCGNRGQIFSLARKVREGKDFRP